MCGSVCGSVCGGVCVVQCVVVCGGVRWRWWRSVEGGGVWWCVVGAVVCDDV